LDHLSSCDIPDRREGPSGSVERVGGPGVSIVPAALTPSIPQLTV